MFREINAVCSKSHTKTSNRARGQNAELLNVKVGGTYSYHCAGPCEERSQQFQL
jgi:hypothetical protein